MSSERIEAMVWGGSSQPRGDTAPRLPQAGATISLVLKEARGDDLLVETGEGIPLRLAGLRHRFSGLTPGDIVLARVLATTPRLQLTLLDAPSGSRADEPASSDQADLPALRLDQLALRQINWATRNAGALAAAWRVRVLGALERHPSVAARLPGPGAAAAALGAGQGLPPVVQERWVFPVFAWDGQPVLLRLVADDDEDGRHESEDCRPAALLVEFAVAGLGRILVRLRIVAAGVWTEFAVEGEAAWQAIRAALPAIAAALGRMRLPLRGCRLNPRLKDARPWAARPGAGTELAAAVPPALFDVAAEIVFALSSPMSPLPGQGA